MLSPSMAQGPARRKKLSEWLNRNAGIGGITLN